MIPVYIEIVHVSPSRLDVLREEGHKQKIIADRISELEKTVGVNYFSEKNLDDNIPDLLKDTPIRVGGALWGGCVKIRVSYLRAAGYRNVIADRGISFTMEDAFQDYDPTLF